MLRRRFLAGAVGASLALTSCGTNVGPSALERSSDTPTTESPLATVPSTTEAPSTTVAPTTTAPPAVQLAGVPGARSPEELAQRVVAAERTSRDPAAAPDLVAAASFELQQLYRQLGRTREWDAAVFDNTPADLRPTVANNVAARREFRNMHSKLSDTLPPWRIVDPPPPEELLGYYREGEEIFGVPWEILAAVNLVETGMGRIRGTSVAGAQGPMQFMPATWAAFGEGDVNNPRDAILGAARYLAHNGGGRGEIDNALWNYNHSNRYVRGVKHYAAVMEEDPAAFLGFYHWQIVYLSAAGDVWLPTGFEQAERITVADYLAANPDHHLGTATG